MLSLDLSKITPFVSEEEIKNFQSAIEMAEKVSFPPSYFVATTGFLFGAFFMWVSDKAVSFTRKRADSTYGKSSEKLNRIIMLILSITLHNIPEGLAVGVAFGALKNTGFSPVFISKKQPVP